MEPINNEISWRKFKKMKNKQGWIKIVEAFIAIFIIMSVAIYIINKNYIEKRDISEKIYDAEIQLLQEIIDKFGKIQINNPAPNSPDEVTIGDFIHGEGDEKRSRIPDYLECGVKLCVIGDESRCSALSTDLPENENGEVVKNIYVQTLPIIETSTALSVECWIK